MLLKAVMKMRSRAINCLLHKTYGAFLANLTRKRNLALKETQGELHYMRALCKKGVFALKKVVQTKKLIK
jgi:predicted transcriptional regulator YheO